MTDNEIIKALEQRMPEDKVCLEAYDLINRQKAEIEVLKKIQQKVLSEQGSYTTNDKTVCCDCEQIWLGGLLTAKSEAYREFAERFKWYVTVAESKPTTRLSYSSLGIVNMIDLVYKELTEKNDKG